MANFDHWMRLNIGDYLADTMHLTCLQHGIYVLLIMHYFKRGELPADKRALARIAKVPMLQWTRHSSPVMALFRIDENGVPRHTRIDHERVVSRELSEKRAKSGKSGAKRRWGVANAKDGDSNCDDRLARAPDTKAKAKANPPPNPSPVINLHARRKKAGGGWADVSVDLAAEEDEA